MVDVTIGEMQLVDSVGDEDLLEIETPEGSMSVSVGQIKEESRAAGEKTLRAEEDIQPLPTVEERANKILGFDDQGNPIAVEDNDSGVSEEVVDQKIGQGISQGINSHNDDPAAHPELSAFISEEADRAEAASSAAFVNADVKTSIEAGLTGPESVEVGEQFQVLSEDGMTYHRYRKDSETVATEVASFPGSAGVQSIDETASRFGIMSPARPADIDFQFASNQIVIRSGAVRLYIGKTSLILPGVTLDISGVGLPTPARVVFSIGSGSYSLPGVADPLPADSVVIAIIVRGSQLVWGVPHYSIDGVVAGDDGFEYQRDGIVLNTSASAINVNTASGNLEVSNNTVRIIADRLNRLIPGQTVPLPSSSGFYRVEFNTLSSSVEIQPANSSQEITAVVWGYLEVLVVSGVFALINVPRWALNGVAQGGGGGGGTPSAQTTVGQMVASASENIDFNFAASEIRIANNLVRLIWGNNTRLLPAETVSLSEISQLVWYRLSYDINERTYAVSRLSVPLPVGSLQVAIFHAGLSEVDGVPLYTVNGERPPEGPETDGVVDADFLVAAGDFEPDYDQPTLPDYSAQQLDAAGDYTKIYAVYDALQASYPGYITSETLGQDALGNAIRCWTFRPEMPRDLTIGARKPKVILVSGVHGNEQSGIWNIFFSLREICDRWRSDKKLEALRWGAEFVVVPIAVPTGFNAFTRKNHNGVDIARNFPSGWVLGSDPEAGTYGGLAPLDQAEAVILDGLMAANRDAVYFGSHHNFFGSSETQGFIWNASATEFGMRLANRLIAIESIKAQKRYTYLPQADDFFLGYTDRAAPPGSEGRHAAVAYGINAGTFEISRGWDYLEPRPHYSTEVATVGVESLINWILLNVKHGTDLVNSKINL